MKAMHVITRPVPPVKPEGVIQKSSLKHWIPAFAGMTEKVGAAFMTPVRVR